MNEKYVLFNPYELAKNDYNDEELYGFWKDGFGYTVLSDAKVYNDAEVVSIKYLPHGTFWVLLPEIKFED